MYNDKGRHTMNKVNKDTWSYVELYLLELDDKRFISIVLLEISKAELRKMFNLIIMDNIADIEDRICRMAATNKIGLIRRMTEKIPLSVFLDVILKMEKGTYPEYDVY